MNEHELKTAYAWDHIKQAGSALAKRGDPLLPDYRELKRRGVVTINGTHIQLTGDYRRSFLAGEDLPSWSDLSGAVPMTRQHAMKKSPAQLQREIDEALKPQQGRYDDRPDAWQSGYDFAKELALHETRTEQREILQRVATRASSAYDRGFVAAYQDMLGIPRSSSTGHAVCARRHHATMGSQKIPSFKISTKAPAAMTALEINKELDKLNAQDSTLGDLMIEAGRGHERPSEYLKMTDPLAMELRKNSDRRQDLRIEIGMRYGFNPPSRLPSGRGFGPRSKTQAPTRGGMGFGKRYGGD